MHPIVLSISKKVIGNLEAALSQANTHACFLDPGNEHWGNMSILNAAHAGELAIKALISKVDPLSVFQGKLSIHSNDSNSKVYQTLINARTHNFSSLPKVLKDVTGIDLPNKEIFEEIRVVRNAVQHFFHPIGFENYGEAAGKLSLKFIYNCIDPIINQELGMCAIEYHEDHSVGYDYVVSCIVRRQIKFCLPRDFELTEISLKDETANLGSSYKNWLKAGLAGIGRPELLS